MKKEEEKRSHHKSGRFLGLTLKGFSKDSSDKLESCDDKVSLLKRFGSRQSSKKKNKYHKQGDGQAKSDTSSSNQDASDSAAQSLSDDVQSDVGQTPNVKRSQTVNNGRVYELMSRSPWGSDSEPDECLEKKKSSIKRHASLKERSRRLRRSMSVLCASSRSRLVPDKPVDPVLLDDRKTRARRSLGASLLSSVITRSRSKLISGKENQSDGKIQSDEKSENHNVDVPDTKTVSQKKPLTKETTSLRRRSLDFLSLSTRKNKPKRDSYDQMNRQRDEIASAKKLQPTKEKKAHIAMTTVGGRCSNYKWMLNNEKMNDDEKSSDNRSRHPSLRRKSFGIMTPHASGERRCSGIYATSATPTFMTCGFIMTDSPPDDLPYTQQKSRNVARCTDHDKEPRSSDMMTKPLTSLLSGYNDDSLPWVAMKRKRRSEQLDKSMVNRCNAGHTPLPPRKKRKSYHERLIN